MSDNTQKSSGLSWLQVTGIVVLVMVASVAATLYFAHSWLFPKPFQPVSLNAAETRQLELKLARLEQFDGIQPPAERRPQGSTPESSREEPLAAPLPEPYSEEGLSREINFSERELNALLANKTDMANRVAIDLADDLVSANMLVTLPPDLPFLGGNTLKIRAGLELAYREARPVVVLRGVSIMGVPIPNAWLGGLKNIDLVERFGSDQGLWQAFSSGVDSIRVQEGRLQIRLKE